MKRDMDLIREMLLWGEDYHDEIIPRFDVGRDALTVQAHVHMLVDGGYLSWAKSGRGGIAGYRISWDGHEFLDKIRDPEIWQKTKSGAERLGSWSIKLLGELASGFVRAKAIELGLPLAS